MDISEQSQIPAEKPDYAKYYIPVIISILSSIVCIYVYALTSSDVKTKLGLGLTGETWRDVIKARTPGTLYPTTPLTYPMYVSVTVHSLNGSQVASLSIDGIIMGYIENHTGATIYSTLSAIVPPGKQYSVGVIKATVYKWYELY
jgi:hypothetical protein